MTNRAKVLRRGDHARALTKQRPGLPSVIRHLAQPAGAVPFELCVEEVYGREVAREIQASGSVRFEMLAEADERVYERYGRPLFQIPVGRAAEPLLDFTLPPVSRVPLRSRVRPLDDPTEANCTIDSPFARIIGFFPDLPETVRADVGALRWLVRELRSAPMDKALIVVTRDPADGGSGLADVLSAAINESRRLPNLFLSGHGHRLQHLQRKVGGVVVPFVVAGRGGYLAVSSDAPPAAARMFSMSLSAKEIHGRFAFGEAEPDCEHEFRSAAGALFLPSGASASLSSLTESIARAE